MNNSCRNTREKEQKKKGGINLRMKALSDKIMAPEYKKHDERVERGRKARARRGACLALGAASFLVEADVQTLGEKGLGRILLPDDQSHVPDIQIEDYMISIVTPSRITNIEMETAGPNFGALIKSLVRFFKGSKAGRAAAERPTIPAPKAARVLSGDGKGLGTGAQRYGQLRQGKRTGYGTPTKEAREAASKSEAVKNIFKSKTFQNCLAVGAGVALGAAATKRQDNGNKYENADIGGGYKLRIDLDAPKKSNFPAPEDTDKILILVADETTGAGDDETPNIQLKTFTDGYNRDDRLVYNTCGSFSGWSINNQITLLQSWNGCCKYYNGEHCEANTALFTQIDREDGQLDGEDNDSVSSFWCIFEDCAGAP